MADVFISYANEDRARAQDLAFALEEYGWSIWWDRSIVAGETFDDVIERELNSAKSVVVLWSRASILSEWVRNEAAEAAKRGVLVPAAIDGVSPPLEFRRKQTVNLAGWDGNPAYKPFVTLRTALATRIGAGVQPRQPAIPQATLFRKIGWNRRLITSFTIAAALFIAGGAFWPAVWRRSDSTFMPDVGTVVKTHSGKNFELAKAIHWGDRSAVFLANSPSSGEVVVKIFRRGFKPGSADIEGFTQEQRAAQILKHPNIAPIFDVGDAGGYPFTVMEYFPGRSLQDWLQTHDRMSGAEILSVATQLAEAIDFAHSKGILHRDIKPSNILLVSNPQGRVALSDFGIARVFGAVEMKITAARDVAAGSPAYLAPEAIKEGKISTASDIYGFGTVLYEMITGKTPFDDRTDVFALLYAKTNEEAPDIRQLRLGASPILAGRVAQTLSRDPRLRPLSAKSVLIGVEDDIARL